MKRRGKRRAGRPRLYWLVAVTAAALAAAGWWFYEWFGRPLTEGQMESYLAESAPPRRLRHALYQLGRGAGGASAARWNPRLIALTSHPDEDVRLLAAAAMALEPAHQPFAGALALLLEDRSARVARRAAISLAAFGDRRSRAVLLRIIHPHTVFTPFTGRVNFLVRQGERVEAGERIALVGQHEIRAPISGVVSAFYEQDQTEVRTGQRLFDLQPSEEEVLAALGAIASAGGPADAAEVEKYAATAPERLAAAARKAAAQILSREPSRTPRPEVR